jgi:uncharacterized phiE125 gp8 family phage protein
MPATLIAGPALEPVPLDDVKAHLRVDQDDEDDLLASAIVAARCHVENATRRVLIAQGWRIHLDRWPRKRMLRLPIAPLISVDEVRVRTGDGPTLVDADEYVVDAASVPGRLLVSGDVPCPASRTPGAIEIDLTAGYGALAADVPSPLRHAIRMLVAHWYEQRGAVGDARPGETVPFGFAALIAPYRIFAP